MGILVYLPGMNGADLVNHFERVGLSELLREGDKMPICNDLEGVGPDDKTGGQVWGWQGDPLGFLPDRQEWWHCKPDPVRGLPAGRYWIGHAKGHRPKPDDLVRDEPALINGFDVMLGDGNEWMFPNLMNLPHRFDLDGDGKPALVPTREFEAIASRALWAYDTLAAHLMEKKELDWQEAFSYCCEMLALNYRVNMEIAAKLELFNEQNIALAMAKTTDCNRLYEVQERLKKKEGQQTPES